MISSNNYQRNDRVGCDVVQVTAEGDLSGAVIYTEIVRMVHEADEREIGVTFVFVTLEVPSTYCYFSNKHSTDSMCLFLRKFYPRGFNC